MAPNPFTRTVTLVPGSIEAGDEESAETQVHLVVLAGTQVGQVFTLIKKTNLIGREDESGIQIMDGGISRRHALIEWSKEGQHYTIKDLESRNGTLLNGVQVTGDQALKKGDKIQLGARTVLRVSFGDELETQYAHQMYQAVLHDGLTGVFNRRYFNKRLEGEVAFALRHKASLTLLLLDIDHFKSINDTYGHPCGDVILQGFSGIIGKAIRAEDVLARYGGEEFVVICRETDESQATMLGERLRKNIANHRFIIDGQPIRITTSIGIAALDVGEVNDPQALVLAADKSLYRAKERGRNCIVCYKTIGE